MNEEPSPPAKVEDDDYVECPVEGCGEVISMEEIDFHIELHAEEAGLDEREQPSPDGDAKVEGATAGSSLDRSTQPATSTRQQHAIQAWKSILTMPSSKRPTIGGDGYSVAKVVKGKRLGVRRNP